MQTGNMKHVKYVQTKLSSNRQRFSRVKRLNTLDMTSHLPDEIILMIMTFLDLKSLLNAACVSQRWLALSESSTLWDHFFRLYTVPSWKGIDLPLSELIKTCQCATSKSKFFKASLQVRRYFYNKKSFFKTNEFTFVTDKLNEKLNSLAVGFELCIIDRNGNPYYFQQSKIKSFNSSIIIQWNSLDNFIELSLIKSIKIFALIPFVFLRPGHALENGPMQKKLITTEHFESSGSNYSQIQDMLCSSDDLVRVYNMKKYSEVAIGLWKRTDEEIAFVAASIHGHNLLKRCLFGSSDAPYFKAHSVIKDDIDKNYGLHSFVCNLHVHSFNRTIYQEKLYIPPCNQYEIQAESFLPEGNFIKLGCIEVPYTKSSLLHISWQTELFKGMLQNVCILDFTLKDLNCDIYWSKSQLLGATSFNASTLDFEAEGDAQMIILGDKRVCICLCCTTGYKSVRFDSLKIYIEMKQLNEWFGTKHKF